MPAAPPNLAAAASFPRGIRVVRLSRGQTMFRIHRNKNGPIWFGPADASPPKNRFDSPNRLYRVFYAAKTLQGAFVEAILHDRPGLRFLAQSYLDDYAFTPITVERSLLLAKLYDDGLAFHGVDAQISASNGYTASRRIAETLFAEAPKLNGIAYRSRHNNGELCYALFDRGHSDAGLRAGGSTPFKGKPAEITALIQRYGIRIDPESPLPPLSPPSTL